MGHPKHSESCPLCRIPPQEYLAQDEDAFMVAAIDDDREIIPGAYLVVTRLHVMKKPTWLETKVQAFCREVGIELDNDTTNHTPKGGRKVPGHAHTWIYVRQPGDPELGLVGLVHQNRAQAAEIAALRNELDRTVATVRHLAAENASLLAEQQGSSIDLATSGLPI